MLRFFQSFLEADSSLIVLLTAESKNRIELPASPSIPSWDQVAGFLEAMRQLRDSAGFAA